MSDKTQSLKAEPVVRCENTIGEGPLWMHSSRRLIWTDIFKKNLYSLDPKTGQTLCREQQSYIACCGETGSGRLIAAGGRGWVLLDEDLCAAQPFEGVPFDDKNVRFNDGKIGPDRAFWVGTMDLKATDPIASLYRLAALEGTTAASLGSGVEVREMERGLTISNGIGWSPDARKMYLTDSKTGTIFSYDFDVAAGRMQNRRNLIRDTEQSGVPDGMAVDAEGNIWSARWGGGTVICYDPKGTQRARIELPAVLVSSCCFGGDHLDTLYITTARYGLAEPGELDGALFACNRAGRGRPSYRFSV